MSECTYTGARVFFFDYDFVVPADLYVVGDVVIIRWNIKGRLYITPDTETTHEVTVGKDGWHREDIGVTVVPKVQFFGPLYR
jgi:hypothetical protein